MNLQAPEIFNKIIDLSKMINDTMTRKGIAIPVENENGSISLGNYTIIKEDQFFSILDYRNEKIINYINLPQTAILLANNLALGKFVDKNLLQTDQKYGYALFEEKLHSRVSKKKSQDKLTLSEIKRVDAKLKKDFYKRAILDRFEKLHKNI